MFILSYIIYDFVQRQNRRFIIAYMEPLRCMCEAGSNVYPVIYYLRVNASKNQRNRGHSSKFNFAHTLSIGRPKSHTYHKDVRLLKFSLVWE